MDLAHGRPWKPSARRNRVNAGIMWRGLIRQCREAFETEARRGFSLVRPTQAYSQSVEEAEGEQPRRGRYS